MSNGVEAALHTPPQSGPTEAEVRALYDRYGPVLLHRCERILGSTELAHDALQETFARVIRHWDSFRGESAQLTWMYRISTNQCLNMLRSDRTYAGKLDVFETDFAGSERVEGGSEAWDRRRVVRRLLDDVDDETRRVVVALYFDELSLRQCSAREGLSVPTVRKRMAFFLKRARRVLETVPTPVPIAVLFFLHFFSGLS